ncbi:MAG: DUF2190 family protein [Candidatus Kapabacteria bacterium]|nr:DUF2190 family protein [Ignavibacteriota bacterium]MCW5886394.1 DUF2190 family protein [Candidatus Kapabacteria bacterium]
MSNPTYSPLARRAVQLAADVAAGKAIKHNGAVAGDGELALGVTEHAYNNGDNGSVVIAGTVLMKIKQQLAAGTLLKADSIGDAIGGVQSGDFTIGELLGSCGTNDWSEVLINKFQKVD